MGVNLTMSVVGWFHTAACVAALALGAWLIVARKGTPRHRRWGDGYVAAIVFASLTSLTIYTRHAFTAAHWFAVMAIVTSLGGFALGRWHGSGPAWKYGHLTCMLLSYYVLIGGGVNEVFLRVEPLRHFIVPQFTPVVGQTHGLVMMAFILLILGFTIATAVSQVRLALRRRKTEAGRLAKAAA
ncbi:MAG: hypothetical protein JSR98_04615 [Proteobacteria bacterium]|nr:hypothetical protein [Pseudomonadota bacterium]